MSKKKDKAAIAADWVLAMMRDWRELRHALDNLDDIEEFEREVLKTIRRALHAEKRK